MTIKTVEIEKEVIKKLKELFGIKMDCLYYGITSTYFEGTKCIIARRGYSRDGKPDKLQVNIGSHDNLALFVFYIHEWRRGLCKLFARYFR